MGGGKREEKKGGEERRIGDKYPDADKDLVLLELDQVRNCNVEGVKSLHLKVPVHHMYRPMQWKTP